MEAASCSAVDCKATDCEAAGCKVMHTNCGCLLCVVVRSKIRVCWIARVIGLQELPRLASSLANAGLMKRGRGDEATFILEEYKAHQRLPIKTVGELSLKLRMRLLYLVLYIDRAEFCGKGEIEFVIKQRLI